MMKNKIYYSDVFFIISILAFIVFTIFALIKTLNKQYIVYSHDISYLYEDLDGNYGVAEICGNRFDKSWCEHDNVRVTVKKVEKQVTSKNYSCKLFGECKEIKE